MVMKSFVPLPYGPASRERDKGHRYFKDVGIVLGLVCMAAGLSYWASALVAFNVWDVWFEANLPRNYSNMVALGSDPSRSNVHPLYSLLVYPPTKVLFKTFGFPLVVAVRVVLSLAASLWVTLLFLALRSVGCHRPDAGLLSLLGLTSAAAIFWLGPLPPGTPFRPGQIEYGATLRKVQLSTAVN
jgi:hypothetical protein